MTPRERVETALRRRPIDRVPFTMYENKVYPCAAERALRNRGMCIVNRHVSVFRSHRPNVQMEEQVTIRDGKRFRRTHYRTPFGELSTLHEEAGFTVWRHEKLFKSPQDYKAILFYLRDERVEPRYDAFSRAREDFGGDVILRAGFGLEPLQMLISSHIMDMNDFCIQWMDNRDEVLKLYDAVVEKRRLLYPIVAQSPALHANYGGNVVPAIIGPETFRQYYLPHYVEAAEIMHGHGKLIGCHFDDDCRLLAPLIAQSGLDYIEAFTPAPDTDMTLAEARAAWPDKVLWINFPSSQHLKSDAEIEAITLDLLDQAAATEGLIMAVTEDIPADRWQGSCTAIMDALERHARDNPAQYAPPGEG